MDENSKLLLRFVYGPASVTQHLELRPYGTDYKRFDVSAGMESNSYAAWIPWVPAYITRLTPFWDVALNVTNGGVSNWASNRTAVLGRGGLSFRFGTADRSETSVRLRFGLGAARSQFNDGKGISPPENWTAIAQGQVSVSHVFCLSRLFCVGPDLGYSVDASSSHVSSHVYLGFLANGMIGPVPEYRPTPVTPTPLSPVGADPGSPIGRPGNPESEVRVEVFIKEINTLKQTIIKIIDERTRLIEKLTQCQNEVSENQVKIIKLIAILATKESLNFLIAAMPQRMILFQNDKVDLFPQKFPGKPEPKWGQGNPALDSVIRRISKRTGHLGSEYTIELNVRGFANDTGDAARNRQLATNRADAVVAYLTGSQSTRDHQGKIIAPLPREGSIGNGAAIKIKSTPPSDDTRDDIRNIILAGKDASQLEGEQKKALEEDIENPIWRMALIEYKVTKNGKEIPAEDFFKEDK